MLIRTAVFLFIVCEVSYLLAVMARSTYFAVGP